MKHATPSWRRPLTLTRRTAKPRHGNPCNARLSAIDRALIHYEDHQRGRHWKLLPERKPQHSSNIDSDTVGLRFKIHGIPHPPRKRKSSSHPRSRFPAAVHYRWFQRYNSTTFEMTGAGIESIHPLPGTENAGKTRYGSFKFLHGNSINPRNALRISFFQLKSITSIMLAGFAAESCNHCLDGICASSIACSRDAPTYSNPEKMARTSDLEEPKTPIFPFFPAVCLPIAHNLQQTFPPKIGKGSNPNHMTSHSPLPFPSSSRTMYPPPPPPQSSPSPP